MVHEAVPVFLSSKKVQSWGMVGPWGLEPQTSTVSMGRGHVLCGQFTPLTPEVDGEGDGDQS